MKLQKKIALSRVPFFRVYINLNVRISWIGIGIFYPYGKRGEPILMGGAEDLGS